MAHVTLPLVSGNEVTIYIGTGHLAVCPSTKEPNSCKVLDGLHNNGGWHVALPVSKVNKMIQEAIKPA